jgi:hypothetical protein
MRFQPGQSGNPRGKPKGAKDPKTKIEALLKAGVINDAFKKDFEAGDKFARQLAYEHFYGKPANKNENDSTHHFPESIQFEIVHLDKGAK